MKQESSITLKINGHLSSQAFSGSLVKMFTKACFLYLLTITYKAIKTEWLNFLSFNLVTEGNNNNNNKTTLTSLAS